MEIIKRNFSIVIALLVAIIAGVLIYFAISSQMSTTPVVVAKNTIIVGKEIKTEDLSVVLYPSSVVPASSFSSVGQIVGSTVINGPIIAGNMVRNENISDASSIRAALETYATEPGWTAIELPPGGAYGMSGLRRGDKVDIYAEVGDPEQGAIISAICQNAIILDKPVAEESDQFIVAVPLEKATVVAELIIRGKPMTLALNNGDSPVVISRENVKRDVQ
ncbi:MAG: hypothetical protein GX154_04005 [Clostridiales bacterium]|nr:hypothetical protein [Clostridiales bacterium]